MPAPAPVALSRDVPLVLTVHDLSFEQRPWDFTPYERLWHRLARPRRLASGAARVIAVSEATRAALADRWALGGERVVVVRNGVERLPEDHDLIAEEAVVARYGLAKRYLLFVGALEPRKAPDVLVRAYAHAREQGLDADLAIAGEGRLARRLSGPGVRLLGHVPRSELDALYASALALVMPSWNEGFGLPPVEALARGTPAVVSDLPVFVETLGDGALRVTPGDAEELSQALLRIAGDPDLRARLAAAGGEAVASLSWERSARAVHAVLAEAAGA
jgi:glycosyltransferase involved in cell wall biosynthesis